MCDDDLSLYDKQENVRIKLEEVFEVSEGKAENLSIILSQCIRENNFHMLREYLLSEIEFSGGLLSFCESAGLNLKEVKSLLSLNKTPDIVCLSKILKELGFKLKISVS